MPITRPAGLAVAVTLCMSAGGCGRGSHHEPTQVEAVGQGTVVARCEHAALGSGDPNWRGHATAVGRLGFVGPGRDFRSAQKVARGSIRSSHPLPSSGPILETKVPVVVEAGSPIDVSIAPADRSRAGLVLAIPGGPYAEVRFVPCRDRARTGWPAGWVLRDNQPVQITVKEEGRPASNLGVGRINGLGA
jgi:hypothetical protein